MLENEEDLIAFCICLFAACSNLQYVENSQAIKLDEAGDKALGFSDVFSPVSVVLLETNAKCLLKNIRKVEQYNGKYYVWGRLRIILSLSLIKMESFVIL